ncbi:MAG: EAL domain-containing protein, partial [Alphaproteobacteria bacterium]
GGLAVNMPLSVLLLPEMPALLAATLRRHGARRGPILLELTETEAIRDPSRLRRVMLRLKRLGIPVLLDDVKLGDHRWRLAGLPFAGLKLDRSLVEALPAQMRARHFLRRILSDSHAKGRYVIAEGVSNPLLRRTASGMGVDFAQGYLLGQPEPPQQNRGGQTRLSPARRGGRAP